MNSHSTLAGVALLAVLAAGVASAEQNNTASGSAQTVTATQPQAASVTTAAQGAAAPVNMASEDAAKSEKASCPMQKMMSRFISGH